MCLSTVYQVVDGKRNLVCENVSGINIFDGYVSLTDIMGANRTVDGALKSIDLIKNIILIEK